MLKKLRFQLTFLYLVSSILLSLIIGAGGYSLVRYYFQSTTDQALKDQNWTDIDKPGNIPMPVYFEEAF